MTPAETLARNYRLELRERRDRTVDNVLALHDDIADGAFPYAAAVTTGLGIADQVTLADAYLALVLTLTRPRYVSALGLLPTRYVDTDRLEQAFRTALDRYIDDPRPAITRIAAAVDRRAGCRAAGPPRL